MKKENVYRIKSNNKENVLKSSVNYITHIRNYKIFILKRRL